MSLSTEARSRKVMGAPWENFCLKWSMKTQQTELMLPSSLLFTGKARMWTVHHWQCSQTGLCRIPKMYNWACSSFFKRKAGNKNKNEKTAFYRALPNEHSGKSLSRKLNLSFSKWYIFPLLPLLCRRIHSLCKEVMKPRKWFELEKTQCTILWIQTFGINSSSQCIEFLRFSSSP